MNSEQSYSVSHTEILSSIWKPTTSLENIASSSSQIFFIQIFLLFIKRYVCCFFYPASEISSSTGHRLPFISSATKEMGFDCFPKRDITACKILSTEGLECLEYSWWRCQLHREMKNLNEPAKKVDELTPIKVTRTVGFRVSSFPS